MFTNDFPWYKTMGFKALMIMVLMLSVVAITITSVLETTGANMVRESENQRIEAQVETVAQSLGQLSNNVSTIALSLADTLSMEDSRSEIERKLVTMLRNENIKQIVAGGGFWPEPFAYEAGKSRSSVFVSLDEKGQYRVYEDYNHVQARPYHIEEWYAPTRMIQGSAYWSRAYIDPYTQESMVTCSVPMYAEDNFLGVVTIDVRLDELQRYLKQSGEKLGGYLVMFDRSGLLMAYPDELDLPKGQLPLLPNFRQITQQQGNFSELALVFSHALQTQYLKQLADPKIHQIAKTLVASSPDIDLNYALSIAHELIPDNTVFRVSERLFIHHLSNDTLLNEPTLVLARVLPETNWILIGALPERFLVAETATLKNDLFFSMLLVALLLVVVTYVAIHFYIVRPVGRVRNALIEQVKSASFSPIEYKGQDELGMLVNEFNQVSSNLNETRERAIEAARTKQLFLANISHEIRTPMNGILGAAALMKDENMSPKQAEYLSVITHSSRGLMSLINNILDYSKIESNHLILEQAPFDLEEVGRYVRDLMLPTIKDKKDLIFDFYYPPKAPTCFVGDAHRIEQVILNLVSNALKFTERGRVSLTMNINHPDEHQVGAVISVTDSGVGISQDKFDLIFEEFQQADLSTTRQYGGSGLGLAITKQLVELMGGEISLTSTLGKGSRFCVCLPLVVQKNHCRGDSSYHTDRQVIDFVGMNCLLVEDNQINMMIAEKMLLKMGFHVVKAEDGLDAVIKVNQLPFDVIFMDIQMPHMDGLEATQKIRRTRNLNQDTPIIAMTANVTKDDIWRCKRHGMQGHIGKPLRIEDIYTVLNDVLSRTTA